MPPLVFLLELLAYFRRARRSRYLCSVGLAVVVAVSATAFIDQDNTHRHLKTTFDLLKDNQTKTAECTAALGAHQVAEQAAMRLVAASSNQEAKQRAIAPLPNGAYLPKKQAVVQSLNSTNRSLLRHKDASLVNTASSISRGTIVDAAGILIGAIVIGFLILLMNSRRILLQCSRIAIDLLPTGVVFLSEHFIILCANDIFTKMYGYERDELAGKQFSELFPAKEREGFLAVRDVALQASHAVSEMKCIHKEGKVFPAIVRMKPYRRANGTIRFWAVTLEDVGQHESNVAEIENQRRVLETTLAAQTAQMSLMKDRLEVVNHVLDKNAVLVAEFDAATGRYLSANRHTLENLGYSKETILSMTLLDVVPGLTPDAYDRMMTKVRSAGSIRVEAQNFRADGSFSPLEVFLAYQDERENTPARIFGFAIDVSERRAAAQMTQAAARAAQASADFKASFLSNMSHEIRGPLNAILSLAYLIRNDSLNETQAARMNKLEVAGRHLMEVINSILELSKIEAGKITLESRSLNLRAVVDGVVTMVSDRAAERGLEILTKVPFAPEGLVGDVTRLQQALLNYVGNAIKFTDHGSVTIRANLQRHEGSRVLVLFEVEDTGVGISQATLGTLFSPFMQGDNSSTRNAGGTGLGLYLVKEIARLMGGEAGVVSDLGQGSTFWFTAWLGVEEIKQPNVSDDYELDVFTLLKRDFAGVRLLVAEDDAMNAEAIIDLLEEAGLRPELALDGAQAVQMAIERDYRLMLLDLQMPKINGLEATRQIRGTLSSARLPIIAITGNAFAENRAYCLAAGMDDFAAKPIDPPALLALVLRWLRRIELAKQDRAAGK